MLMTEEALGAVEGALGRTLQDIFATMFCEQARLIPPAEIDDVPHVSSIIGIAGRLSGFISLHFSSSSACNIAAGLLGMEVGAVDETVRDAVGELVNMVAGGLKNQLSTSQEMFKISIPSVIEGDGYSTRGPAGSRELAVGVVAGPYRFKCQLVLDANH